MDPQQQQQEMSSNSNTLENMLGCSKEKKPKPQAEHAQKCPRCESTNTKFCYYNNYSLSQPRYFCKSCRRYWTKGGTLRNVPVGGGCRKNKRSSSSSSSKRSQSQDQQPLLISTNQNPVLTHLASSYDSNDLTLAFARLQKQQQQSGGHHLGFDHHDQFSNILGSAAAANQGGSFLDALRCGYLETQNQNPNNFQNLYYGYEGNGEVENGSGSCGADVSGEMVLPYGHEMGTTTATTTAVTVTTMKQEICNGSDSYRDQGSDQNRMLWGLPWQINGDHHHHQSINMTNNVNNLGDLDSGRESWNGFAPSWHGLLNSPLM